jgi:diaminopimelate decarboxylase
MSVEYLGPSITNELGSEPLDAAFERNPLARGRHRDFLDAIDGVPVEKLVKDYGTPLFVMSENKLRTTARRMRKAFRDAYPRVEFRWSFKTNPLDALCAVLRAEGWGAEVVSSYEYKKARRMGFEGHEIVFNGPYKSRGALEQALRDGSMIQIDNWEELSEIEDLAKKIGGVHQVGVRVQMATGYSPEWTKFGFPLSNGEAEQAALRVVRNDHLRLHTLHTHLGTYILEPRAYRVATQLLLGLRESLFEEAGFLVECLNLGGGFPSDSLLHGMVGPPEQVIPPIERYAEAITDELNMLPARKRPLLRLEAGRHLVDNAGSLLTSVVAVKSTQFAAGPPRACYVVDSGVNLFYTAAWFAIQATPTRTVDSASEPAKLVGDLCMEIDVIREQVMLPRLQVRDVLTLHPVGAYNFNQSMDFIHLRPAVVMIGPGGQVEVIRRGEELEDFSKLEVVPARLRKG